MKGGLREEGMGKCEKIHITYIVDVMKNIAPERVEDGWGHQEATNTHPKAVCKRSES